MTAIGKMLVFLVLVLSLAWNFLTVNAYVARTNWRAEAKRYQGEAEAMQKAAQNMKQLLDTERDSADDAKRALGQERDRLYAQVKTLQDDRNSLNAQYSAAFAAGQTQAADAVKLQANVAKLTQQVTDLDAQLKQRDTAVADLTLAKNAAVVEANRAKLDAETADRRSADLEGRVAKLQSDVQELSRNGGLRAAPGTLTPAVPEKFRGSVVRYADGFVELEPGLDARLREGAVLDVQRLTGGGKYLGRIVIVTVYAKNAVGRFEPANTGRPATVADLPRPGDTVVASR